MKHLLFLVLLLVSVNTYCQYPPLDSSYYIVFQDEFDTLFPGTVIDTASWDRTPPWNQASNNINTLCDTVYLWDQAYMIRALSDTTTIMINNGICSLKVNRPTSPYVGEVWNWPPCDTLTDSTLTGIPCIGPCAYDNLSDTVANCFIAELLPFKYTRGTLFSKHKYKYGFFELKFRLPVPPTPASYQGIGPNFWLYAAEPNNGVTWSEIDVFELHSFSSTPDPDWINHYTTNVHFDNDNDPNAHLSQTFDFGNITAGVWHKAAAWWTPNFVKFYFNDLLIHAFPVQVGIPIDSLVAMPMFIDMNAPSPTACINWDTLNNVFPYVYELDYVRIYQLKQDCLKDTFYCNVTETTFQDSLYKSLTIGGISCTASFGNSSATSGIGIDFVELREGFVLNSDSSGYFDVFNCFTGQSKSPSYLSPNPPPNSFRIRH